MTRFVSQDGTSRRSIGEPEGVSPRTNSLRPPGATARRLAGQLAKVAVLWNEACHREAPSGLNPKPFIPRNCPHGFPAE